MEEEKFCRQEVIGYKIEKHKNMKRMGCRILNRQPIWLTEEIGLLFDTLQDAVYLFDALIISAALF